MFYPARNEAQTRRRQRTEEPSKEEADLRERLRESWPADITNENGMDAEEISGRALRRILQEHDRPHRDVKNESWHVNGLLGRQRRFAFTATFSLTAVNSSVNPPDESSDLNNLSDVQWTITDNRSPQQKYYRFSCLDHRAPVLLSALLAKGELGSVEDHVMQATVEQLNNDSLISPDQCMSRLATARFSELDLRFGDSFLRRVPSGNRAEGVDILSITKYHLHLEGRTNDNTAGDLALESKATLDLVFTPRAVPILDGNHGIIGHGDWKTDLFCHSFPHMKVEQCSLRITRASDDLELARELEIRDGSIWMDHRFGGVVPRSTAEAAYLRTQRKDIKKPHEDVILDRCMLRLFNENQDCLAVTRVAPVAFSVDGKNEPRDDRESEHLFASIQSAKSRAAYGYWSTPADRTTEKVDPLHNIVLEADPTKRYRSKETGVLYPTEFTLKAPTYGGAFVELVLRVSFPEQELTSSLLQPSAWVGTVSAEGTISTPAPGEDENGKQVITSKLMGEGILQMFGYGVVQNAGGLFDTLRAAATVPMEAKEVAEIGKGREGWKKIADGPALVALNTVRTVLSMQQMELSNDHKVVLATMLATYGYIFHHHGSQEAVEEALSWCQGKWITYFGQNPINNRTLLIRAFMLRELGRVMHAKCAAWVPKEAVALDIAAASLQAANATMEVSEAMQGKQIPSAEVVAKTPTALEFSQLKALMDGKWDYKDATGNVSAVLIEQHVPILWRNLMGKVHPTVDYLVDREQQKITYAVKTIIEESDHEIFLNGQEWTWRCPARGPLRSRACVLEDGKQLYMESYVRQGVERIWYTFSAKGLALDETVCYYRSRAATEPAAWCVRTYMIDRS